jgi:hypothetical protein
MVRRLLLAGVFVVGGLIAPAIHPGAMPLTVSASSVPAAVGLTPPIPLNSGGCYWTNCTEAHQNGEGNISQGNAHYCSKQDRDGDGIACEW